MSNLQNWTRKKYPELVTLEGAYVRIEPLTLARHGDDIFEETRDEALWCYLPDRYTNDRNAFDEWFNDLNNRDNFVFYAIVNRETGRTEGSFALMRTDAANGVTEVGVVIFGPKLKRSRKATEAIYLTMRYVFDTLGYRRFEWKCDNNNEPSKIAARRFGFSFEGLFRQHLIIKGRNRDTAWFSIIDNEWPKLKVAFEAWLAPTNFDAEGHQKKRLEDFRAR